MKAFDFNQLEADLSCNNEKIRLDTVQKIMLYPEFQKGEIPRFLKALTANLQDSSTAVRYYAKKAFARLKQELGTTELALIMSSLIAEGTDLSWETQPTFVYGTKAYWLYELSSIDFKIRVKAIIELSETPDETTVDRLFELLGEERHEHVVATLVKYLACYNDDRYFGAVLPYLSHPDNRVRANTIEGIELAGVKEAAIHIIPLLKDADNRVRANAAKFLMNSHRDDVEATIMDMMDSEFEWMRDSAVFVIDTVKPAHAMELLEKLTSDSNTEIAEKATVSIGKLEMSSTVISLLEKLTASNIPEVKIAAKKALKSSADKLTVV
jgi:HEAT repeat protein